MKKIFLFLILIITNISFSEGFDYGQLDDIKKQVDTQDIKVKLNIGGSIENQFYFLYLQDSAFYDEELKAEYPYKQIIDNIKANIFFKSDFSNTVNVYIDLGVKADLSDIDNNSFYNMFTLREAYISLNALNILFFKTGFIKESLEIEKKHSINCFDFMKTIHNEYYDDEIGLPQIKLSIQPTYFFTIEGSLFFDKIINYKDLTSSASIKYSNYSLNISSNYYFLRDFVNSFSTDEDKQIKTNQTHYVNSTIDYSISNLYFFYEGGIIFGKSKYFLNDIPGEITTEKSDFHYFHNTGIYYDISKIHLKIGNEYLYSSAGYTTQELKTYTNNLNNIKKSYIEKRGSSLGDIMETNYYNGISLFSKYNTMQHIITTALLFYNIFNTKTDINLYFMTDPFSRNFFIENEISTKYINNVIFSLQSFINISENMQTLSFKYIPVQVIFSTTVYF